jgi:hypothetical protein
LASLQNLAVAVDLSLDVALRNLLNEFSLGLHETYPECLSYLSNVDHLIWSDKLLQVSAPYLIENILSREENVAL